MIESLRASSEKRSLLFILISLAATALSIWLDIPVLRQVLGFAFFTFAPGLLILCLLRLNKLGLTEKLVLSVGLSISFLMFAGLLINWIYPAFGYYRPLSTNSLLISFSVMILILAIVVYLRNEDVAFARLSDFKLTTTEKAFLILPALFPLLSILGMHIMNTTGNNTMLMALLFLIPAYTIFIAVNHSRVPDRVYAPIILFTSISLVLLMGLRSSFIMGTDTHVEYYLFRQTFYNALWQIPLVGLYDAALSVSILPTIYHSFLNIDSQYLFKILHPILFSFAPVIVYLISKKYIGNRYAFLASLFFMSQSMFLMVTMIARTSLAILFFALAIMVLLSGRLGELHKKLLFIVFAFSCIVSHYTTAYIFLFILLFTWVGMQIIGRILPLQKGAALPRTLKIAQPRLANFVSFGIVTIFFALVFFWNSQVTGIAFEPGVRFIYTTLITMGDFFILEARNPAVAVAFGYGIGDRAILVHIHFVVYWLMITFIAIGVLTTSARYRHVLAFSPETNGRASEFLPQKIDALFLILSVVCSAVMAVAVALPFVFAGYGLDRAFAQMMIVLSPFFVIGGIRVARLLRVRKVYLLILIILIPFFMSQTAITNQIFGIRVSMALNSEGPQFDLYYVHEEEGYAARWLRGNVHQKARIYTDRFGLFRLYSQAMVRSGIYDPSFIQDKQAIGEGYVFLRGANVIAGKLLCSNREWHDLTEYEDLFVRKTKIYDNGGSQVWKANTCTQ